MDTPIIIAIVVALLLAALAAVLLTRKKGAAKAAAHAEAAPGPAPAALDNRKQEVQNRIAEFMERDLFCLVIQPIIDLQSGTVCGGEVLSRLNHPEQGVIFPDLFLPAVNAQGLHAKFDYYIFEKNCKWISNDKQQREDYIYTINFSRSTLSEPDFAQRIIAIAEKYDLIVIADDIYTSFSYQNEFVPFASLPGMKERTITLNSFSKNFTMTGWRLGNIIAPDYIIRTIISNYNPEASVIICTHLISDIENILDDVVFIKQRVQIGDFLKDILDLRLFLVGIFLVVVEQVFNYYLEFFH